MPARNDATGVRGRKSMRSRCVQDDRVAAVLRADQAIRETSVVALGRTAFSNRRYDGYRPAHTRRPVFHAKKRNAGVQKGDPCMAGSTDDSAHVADHDASVATKAAAVRSRCSLRKVAPSRSRPTIRHALDAPLREMTNRVFTRLCSPTQRAEKANQPRLAAPCSARAGASCAPRLFRRPRLRR